MRPCVALDLVVLGTETEGFVRAQQTVYQQSWYLQLLDSVLMDGSEEERPQGRGEGGSESQVRSTLPGWSRRCQGGGIR